MARAETYDAPEADRANGCLHPRSVYDLVGHTDAQAQFAELLEKNHLHHAWLISGPSGIGKATLAYRMVRRVLGGVPLTQGALDVPADDPTAQRIQSLGHGDFHLVRRPYDEKTKKIRAEIPVSEARKISSFFTRKAAEGGWRVCLIDGIDDMNRNASNAVLKTLEEPPEKALLILLTKSPGKLLPTIRSRCHHTPLRAVPADELQNWLKSKVDGVQNDDFDAAVRLSGGAPGKALALIQNADTVLRPLGNFMRGFPQVNGRLLHTISDMLAPPKADISYQLFWDALGEIVQAQAIYSSTGAWESAYKPMALGHDVKTWLRLYEELKHMRAAQSGLNMNKKTVLLQVLTMIGTGRC